MTTIQIKHRWTGAVLFECEAPDGLERGQHIRHSLEKATEAGANLAGANLAGAYLPGANLAGAYLARAYLAAANLAGAYLAGANLADANLADANLAGANLARANLARAHLAAANLAGAYLADAYLAAANLADANLAGAYLADAYLADANLADGLKLVGGRPVLTIGPIGSRCAYFTAYLTDHGQRFDIGCQRQITRDQFEQRLADTHGDNEHAREYRAALALIDLHAELWTPKEGAA